MTAEDASSRWAWARLPDDRAEPVRRIWKLVLNAPFQARAWSELAFFLVSGLVAAIGAVLVAATIFAGSFLSVVFVGVIVFAGGLRGVRGIGSWHRALARHFLGERIDEPEPFRSRPGFVGWLGAALRDRAAWRALGYTIVKIPLVIFGAWFAVRIWFEAALYLISGVAGIGTSLHVGVGGVPGRLLDPGFGGGASLRNRLAELVSGAVLLFIAPWTMRFVVYLDRLLIGLLLGPDPIAARVRSLEQSRAKTIDASAATLRRIERDLHDGTQAQLVALAMRLGQVKEKLAEGEQADLAAIRQLVDDAHRGAKEAIVELRDLARGIHPPVLDVGLEGALATLASRSAVPTTLQVDMRSRPSPAIETISYFCVAELLANVAQHARASQASISCAEHGPWLRIVVRDDGQGGAAASTVGSASSGLVGLADRVASIDGHFSIASPPGGRTAITIDLPLTT